jgi:polar amino acid transport system substrate-binding protein
VRRFAILAAIALFASGAAACGSSSKPSAAGDPSTTNGSSQSASTTTTTPAPVECSGKRAYVTDVGTPAEFKPVAPGTLTVVTSLPSPGFWDGSDANPAKITSGYEHDIAAVMQQAFGLSKLVVRNESFDSITSGTLKNYDVALSQVAITCDRAKVAKFTMPYFQSTLSVLVNKGTTVANLDDAKRIQWGVQKGTTAIDLLDTIKPAKSPKIFQSLADTYVALQAREIDAVLVDTVLNLNEAARSNGKFEVVAQFDHAGGTDQYAALLPKDSTNGPAINAVFKSLIDAGQLEQLASTDLAPNPGTIPTISVP